MRSAGRKHRARKEEVDLAEQSRCGDYWARSAPPPHLAPLNSAAARRVRRKTWAAACSANGSHSGQSGQSQSTAAETLGRDCSSDQQIGADRHFKILQLSLGRAFGRGKASWMLVCNIGSTPPWQTGCARRRDIDLPPPTRHLAIVSSTRPESIATISLPPALRAIATWASSAFTTN